MTPVSSQTMAADTNPVKEFPNFPSSVAYISITQSSLCSLHTPPQTQERRTPSFLPSSLSLASQTLTYSPLQHFTTTVYNAFFVTADLHGITNLQPRNGLDDPDHPYFFKLKCENCDEISKKPYCVIQSERVPRPDGNGKGTVNLVQKCKLCDRVLGTIEIVSGQGKGKPSTKFEGQSNKYVLIAIFDCHGLSPVEFSFQGQWKDESTKSKATFDIDMSGGEFALYDDASGVLFLSATPSPSSEWCASVVDIGGPHQLSIRED